jgi:hypothetical protein
MIAIKSPAKSGIFYEVAMKKPVQTGFIILDFYKN